MKRQMLVASLLPAAALVALVAGAVWWENSGGVPVELSFSEPLVRALRENGARVTHVSHASHVEPSNGHAARIMTTLGSVTVIQFENQADAQAQRREAQNWYSGHLLFTMGSNAMIFTDQPELDRLIKRAVLRARF